MHFLLIHQSFATPDEPGGTRHFELARGAAERGHEFTVIASEISYLTGQSTRGASVSKADATIEGVRVVRAFTPSTFGGGFDVRIARRLQIRTSIDWDPTFLSRAKLTDPEISLLPIERRKQSHGRLSLGVVWRF